MEFKAHGENHQEDSIMEAVVKSRNGSILGKHSILKMYFFPGQKTTSDHVPINGAPHVCKVSVGICDTVLKTTLLFPQVFVTYMCFNGCIKNDFFVLSRWIPVL
jgi:hypothetical protein